MSCWTLTNADGVPTATECATQAPPPLLLTPTNSNPAVSAPPRLSTTVAISEPLATSTSTAAAPPQTNSPQGSAAQDAPPPASSVRSSGSQGVAPGAVAGIAVATFIAGVVIALLVFLFFRRRGRPSRREYNGVDARAMAPPDAKQAAHVQVSQTPGPPMAVAATLSPKPHVESATSSNPSDVLARVLPQGADEETVKSRVADLFHWMQHHVDCYYRNVHATMTPTMETDLARLVSDSFDIVKLLQDSAAPTAAIKHALASYLLSIVSPEAEHQSALFPAEIAGLKQHERCTDTADKQAAYTLYRRLAVLLLHGPPTASLASREADMRVAAEHFALTFFPWADPAQQEQEKDEELVRIIRSALELSIWLYGQPFTYEFVWDGGGRRGTVVAPGLARAADSTGQAELLLLEPVVEAG